MSWDAWVTHLIAEGNAVAGIYGDDGSIWTQLGEESDKITPSDVKVLRTIMNEGNKSSYFASGVTFSNQTPYTLVKVEEDCVILKGKGDKSQYSMVAIKTNRACVIALSKSNDGSGAREVNNKVRVVAENLKKENF